MPGGETLVAVEQVAAHVQVREQLAVLEHQAEVALPRGHEDAARTSTSTSSARRSVPLCGCSNPAISASSVLLPEPDGPQMPVTPPADRRVRVEAETAARDSRDQSSACALR